MIIKGLTEFVERNPLFATLLFFMIMDIITGLLAAGVERKLSSPISYAGMLRKFLIISMVFTAQVMDWLALTVYKIQSPIAGTIMIFFLVREILSILENSARGGLPIPDQIKDRLAIFTQAGITNMFSITSGVIQATPANSHAVSNILAGSAGTIQAPHAPLPTRASAAADPAPAPAAPAQTNPVSVVNVNVSPGPPASTSTSTSTSTGSAVIEPDLPTGHAADIDINHPGPAD